MGEWKRTDWQLEACQNQKKKTFYISMVVELERMVSKLLHAYPIVDTIYVAGRAEKLSTTGVQQLPCVHHTPALTLG